MKIAAASHLDWLFDWRTLLPAMLTVTLAFGVHQLEQRRADDQIRQQTLQAITALRANLESAVTSRLALNQAITAIAKDEPQISQAAFARFANRLLEQQPDIRSLQWAPDGVVRRIHPIQGNQAAIDLDLRSDPLVHQAIRERQMMLAGPQPLRQGGEAIIARQPVFSDARGNQPEQFLGFAVVIIDLPALYRAAGIERYARHYKIALRRSDGNASRSFFGEDEVFTDPNSQTTFVSLPNADWQLGMRPSHTPPGNLAGALLAAVTLLALSGILYISRRAFIAERDAVSRATHIHALYNLSPVMLHSVDADGHLLDVNQTWLDTFGYQREEVIGHKSVEFLTPPSRVFAETEVIPNFFVRGNVRDIPYQFVTKSGKVLDTLLSADSVCDSNGHFLRSQAAIQNVTERKRIEAALEKARAAAEAASQAKTDFLANMSHEIRTPMNAVIGLGQLLADSQLDDTQREYLNMMQGASENLLAILNDILDFSKIESGHMELEETDFQLQDLIAGTRDLFAANAQAKGLEFVCTCEAHDIPALHGDALRLGQVLNNLVSNALKFTERGRITIHAECIPLTPEQAQLQISVSDTGIGIAEADRKRLFNAFEQADNSISRRFGGTGLGLSICRHLLVMMEGDITVDSSLGRGSTFHVSLTLPIAKTPPVAGESSASALPRFDGTRVLLVEDNPTNQLVARELLHRLGLAVDVSSSAEEALSKLQEQSYDGVLMDVHLPGIDGMEATRRLRADPRLAKLPVIAMTAAAMRSEQAACIAAGMNDHIAKPIEAARLASTLTRWLPMAHMGHQHTPDQAIEPFSLPGLDLNQAAQRVEGDWSLLRRVLHGFADDFATAATVLDQALAAGDFEHAARLVHTIKGLAPNLGASALEQAARQLETELGQGQAHTRQAFESALANVLQSIACLPPQDSDTQASTVGQTIRAGDLLPQLQRLAEMLKKRQGKARTLAAEIAATLAGSPDHAAFVETQRHIDKLQFAQADAALTEMLAGIAITRGTSIPHESD